MFIGALGDLYQNWQFAKTLSASSAEAMIFDAQLPQAVLFKKVAESMKDLCKEVGEVTVRLYILLT